uniref:Putative apolipoprotein n-acyltransferase n=1 Tax=Paulinella micropora TaxID=1928728 RepID=A0A385HZC7_9EUKA|nr:putative apolipoprotein n-acyltransferase [Paulinella micropora]AXY63012.1 putative apolipoprotein n-acyltransferase [Paulinella micropora]
MNKQSIISLFIISSSGVLFGWNLVPSTTPWISWLSIAILWEGLTFNPFIIPESLTIRAALVSCLWGFIAVLVSHRWLLWLHPIGWIGIPNFLSFPISLLLLIGLAIAGALLVGTWGVLAIWLDPRRPFSAFILAGIWGLAEIFLAKGPLFWIGLGISTLPGDRILTSFAALGGMGTLAAMQLLIGWSFWKLVLITQNNSKHIKSSVLLWVILISCLHIVLYSHTEVISNHNIYKTSLTSTSGLEKILVWQPSIPTREKFGLKEQIKLLAKLKTIESYSSTLSIPLVLAPEGTLDINQFTHENPTFELLTGGFHQSRNHIYSAVLDFIPTKNQTVSWTNKRRLVPLGEWVPFRRIWQWDGLSAIGGIDQGTSPRILNREKETIGIGICYELSDGTTLAAATHVGIHWLIVLGNLDPYRGLLQKQFEALAQLRAIETGRWLVSVVNTGPSSVINNQGAGHKILPAFLPSLGIIELRRTIHLTPYDIFGEWFLAIIILGAGIILALSKSIKPPLDNRV